MEVSSGLLNVESPSMPAKSPWPFTGMFFVHLVFQFFIEIWTHWCLGRHQVGHTRLFYTQAYYAKDVGTGVPPFPPYLWEN